MSWLWGGVDVCARDVCVADFDQILSFHYV